MPAHVFWIILLVAALVIGVGIWLARRPKAPPAPPSTVVGGGRPPGRRTGNE